MMNERQSKESAVKPPLGHFLLDIPTLPDQRGNLAVLEVNKSVFFDIKRVYYLFDVPSGAMRGGHAHLALDQLLIAISGSFVVEVEDKHSRTTYTLNRPNRALYVGPMAWREMRDFSSNAVCLVLASELYDEADYIRSYEEFSRIKKGGQ